MSFIKTTMSPSFAKSSASAQQRINQLFLAATLALGWTNPGVHAQDAVEGWRQLKLVEIKGKVADRAQNRGLNDCLIKTLEGDEKEILLANFPSEAKKAFDVWQTNRSPGPALQKLEAELSARRADYVAAVNSGTPEQIQVATKSLETTKEQLARMRELATADPKDDTFPIRARSTGQTYENLEIWDCSSQKEFDAAFAVALKARKEQDARQAAAKARLKTDQELAAKNDPDGIFKMAERYYLGDRLAGITRDPAKARALYEKAAAMGHADAATALKHLQNPSAR